MCRTCLLLLTDVTAIEADLSASQQRPQARAMQVIPPAVRVIPRAVNPPAVQVIPRAANPPAVQVIPRAAIPPAVRVIPPAVRVSSCTVRVTQIWLMYQSREFSYQ